MTILNQSQTNHDTAWLNPITTACVKLGLSVQQIKYTDNNSVVVFLSTLTLGILASKDSTKYYLFSEIDLHRFKSVSEYNLAFHSSWIFMDGKALLRSGPYPVNSIEQDFTPAADDHLDIVQNLDNHLSDDTTREIPHATQLHPIDSGFVKFNQYSNLVSKFNQILSPFESRKLLNIYGVRGSGKKTAVLQILNEKSIKTFGLKTGGGKDENELLAEIKIILDNLKDIECLLLDETVGNLLEKNIFFTAFDRICTLLFERSSTIPIIIISQHRLKSSLIPNHWHWEEDDQIIIGQIMQKHFTNPNFCESLDQIGNPLYSLIKNQLYAK